MAQMGPQRFENKHPVSMWSPIGLVLLGMALSVVTVLIWEDRPLHMALGAAATSAGLLLAGAAFEVQRRTWGDLLVGPEYLRGPGIDLRLESVRGVRFGRSRLDGSTVIWFTLDEEKDVRLAWRRIMHLYGSEALAAVFGVLKARGVTLPAEIELVTPPPLMGP